MWGGFSGKVGKMVFGLAQRKRSFVIFSFCFSTPAALFRLRFNQFAGVELFWGEVAKRWAEKLINFGGKRFWGARVLKMCENHFIPTFRSFRWVFHFNMCMYVCLYLKLPSFAIIVSHLPFEGLFRQLMAAISISLFTHIYHFSWYISFSWGLAGFLSLFFFFLVVGGPAAWLPLLLLTWPLWLLPFRFTHFIRHFPAAFSFSTSAQLFCLAVGVKFNICPCS